MWLQRLQAHRILMNTGAGWSTGGGAYFLIQKSVGRTLDTLKLLPAQTLMCMATSVMNLSKTNCCL